MTDQKLELELTQQRLEQALKLMKDFLYAWNVGDRYAEEISAMRAFWEKYGAPYDAED